MNVKGSEDNYGKEIEEYKEANGKIR